VHANDPPEIPTFLFAGHETTSSALTWVLYSLACNQGIQDALRAEVLACTEGERPSMDTLAKMPYMDAVVRETLRLYAPVAAMAKTVMQHGVLPTENKWVDRKGKMRDGVQYVISVISDIAHKQVMQRYQGRYDFYSHFRHESVQGDMGRRCI
jgi:hypothetical protein